MAISDLVTSKSATSIIEGLKTTLATPAPSLTPSTFTAMIGINQGSALQLAAPVQATMSQLANIAASNSSANVQAVAALSSLTTLQNQIMPSGNHGAFGQILNQAHSHIGDAKEIQSSTSFMQNTSYAECGAGITNMSTMATQGLDGSLGSLSGAAGAFTAAGPVFDLKDMSNFGTGTGLINKLSSVKLGNASGVNAALVQNGVDLNRLNDFENV